MVSIMEFKRQALVIFAAFWTFAIAAIISGINFWDLFLFYGLFTIATATWTDYASRYKLLVWGFCTWICVVVSVFVFDTVDSALISVMSISSQVFYYFVTTFGNDNEFFEGKK